MSFGVSGTSSVLFDPIVDWLPLTFGFAFDPRRLGWIGFREDAPPWRYGRGVGVRAFGRFWFCGWSRRVHPPTATDGSIRMLGGRDLLNEPVDIGGWGVKQPTE